MNQLHIYLGALAISLASLLGGCSSVEPIAPSGEARIKFTNQALPDRLIAPGSSSQLRQFFNSRTNSWTSPFGTPPIGAVTIIFTEPGGSQRVFGIGSNWIGTAPSEMAYFIGTASFKTRSIGESERDEFFSLIGMQGYRSEPLLCPFLFYSCPAR